MENSEYCTQSRKPFLKIAADLTEKNYKVLDAGCGDSEFKDMAKGKLYLLDMNKVTVDKLIAEGYEAKQGIISELPYPNYSFNIIHCSHVIEHLQPEDVYKFMTEAKRCLKYGGYLIISAPLMWSGFYSDLSHIRPYNPIVFTNYLCSENTQSRTRKVIGGFERVSLVYRTGIGKDCSTIVTGFTLVLMRNDDKDFTPVNNINLTK